MFSAERVTDTFSTGSTVTVNSDGTFSKTAFITTAPVTSTVNFPSASGCVSTSFTVRILSLYPLAADIWHARVVPFSTSSPDATSTSPLFTDKVPSPSVVYSTLNFSVAVFSFITTEIVQSPSTMKVLPSIASPLTLMQSSS